MKTILAGLLLSEITTACFAAPVSVEISFQGADYSCEESWNCYDPSARLEVSFTGEDLNNDQVITSDEVTRLIAFGQDFASPAPPQKEYYIYTFQYYSNSNLTISLLYLIDLTDLDFIVGGSTTLTNYGARWQTASGGPWYADSSNSIISIVSVPEPSGIAMSATGLGLVGFAARRRRRAASH